MSERDGEKRNEKRGCKKKNPSQILIFSFPIVLILILKGRREKKKICRKRKEKEEREKKKDDPKTLFKILRTYVHIYIQDRTGRNRRNKPMCHATQTPSRAEQSRAESSQAKPSKRSSSSTKVT